MELAIQIGDWVGFVGAISAIAVLTFKLRAAHAWIDEIIEELEKKS